MLRLSGLAESPTAFISTVEEESLLPLSVIEERLSETVGSAVYGAWQCSELCGIAGIRREPKLRLQHKSLLWGVYVARTARGQGVARELIKMCLAFAKETGVRQVNLGVNAKNAPARHLYETLGFRSFGVERNFMCVDGEWQDEVHMVCVLRE
jgi:RimJ/RimL family protein N-acetyltransferase